MEYCPYCSTSVNPSQKICPKCKKTLDLHKLQSMYESAETTEIDKKVQKQIWFKEHSHIIYPFIALLIGLIAGIIGAYSFAQIQFITEQSDFKEQVRKLEEQINSGKAAAGDVKDELKQQLNNKDKHISILKEQRDIMNKVISFTRRLATSSVITPNTVEEGEHYNRNILYLIGQFENQNQLLIEGNFEANPGYNLQTIPQLMNE